MKFYHSQIYEYHDIRKYCLCVDMLQKNDYEISMDCSSFTVMQSNSDIWQVIIIKSFERYNVPLWLSCLINVMKKRKKAECVSSDPTD